MFQVPYDDIGTMSPTQYWAILHPDSPLAGMASLLCSIPASQADVERVFSSAKFQSDGRGRLALDLLAKEVYIRVNTQRLNIVF